MSTYDSNENYRFIIDIFIKIVERHAPLKKRFVKGNQAPFMNKKLRKAIYTRSRLRNNFCKNPPKKMKRSTKYKEINMCLLKKKSTKKYFMNISKSGVVSNKDFWSMTKRFLTNEGHINAEKIILKCDNETITESSVLAEMLTHIT